MTTRRPNMTTRRPPSRSRSGKGSSSGNGNGRPPNQSQPSSVSQTHRSSPSSSRSTASALTQVRANSIHPMLSPERFAVFLPSGTFPDDANEMPSEQFGQSMSVFLNISPACFKSLDAHHATAWLEFLQPVMSKLIQERHEATSEVTELRKMTHDQKLNNLMLKFASQVPTKLLPFSYTLFKRVIFPSKKRITRASNVQDYSIPSSGKIALSARIILFEKYDSSAKPNNLDIEQRLSEVLQDPAARTRTSHPLDDDTIWDELWSGDKFNVGKNVVKTISKVRHETAHRVHAAKEEKFSLLLKSFPYLHKRFDESRFEKSEDTSGEVQWTELDDLTRPSRASVQQLVMDLAIGSIAGRDTVLFLEMHDILARVVCQEKNPVAKLIKQPFSPKQSKLRVTSTVAQSLHKKLISECLPALEEAFVRFLILHDLVLFYHDIMDSVSTFLRNDSMETVDDKDPRKIFFSRYTEDHLTDLGDWTSKFDQSSLAKSPDSRPNPKSGISTNNQQVFYEILESVISERSEERKYLRELPRRVREYNEQLQASRLLSSDNDGEEGTASSTQTLVHPEDQSFGRFDFSSQLVSVKKESGFTQDGKRAVLKDANSPTRRAKISRYSIDDYFDAGYEASPPSSPSENQPQNSSAWQV